MTEYPRVIQSVGFPARVHALRLTRGGDRCCGHKSSGRCLPASSQHVLVLVTTSDYNSLTNQVLVASATVQQQTGQATASLKPEICEQEHNVSCIADSSEHGMKTLDGR